MTRSAQVWRRRVSAVLIVAAAVLLNVVLVRISHFAGHPLMIDTVFTGIAAAACGPFAGAMAGLSSTLAIRAIGACPVCAEAVPGMNALAGLVIGLTLFWSREITPRRLLLALLAVVIATSVGTAIIADDLGAFAGSGGLSLIRTTYRVLDVDPPWPELFHFLPLNLADKMLTVGVAVLAGPLLGSYRARWVAGTLRSPAA